MYFLYADESGSSGNAPGETFFVLAGISVSEQNIQKISGQLDRIVDSVPSIGRNRLELHGSPMLAGREGWGEFDKADRIKTIKAALQLIDGRDVRIFAAVVRKNRLRDNALTHCFKQLIIRFDRFLGRKYGITKTAQKGLIIFDKSTAEPNIQALGDLFSKSGHNWGKLKYMAEVPVFINSKATRLVQLADLVAYAIYRKYERQDDQFFKIIQNKFDSHDGVPHGFYEFPRPRKIRKKQNMKPKAKVKTTKSNKGGNEPLTWPIDRR